MQIDWEAGKYARKIILCDFFFPSGPNVEKILRLVEVQNIVLRAPYLNVVNDKPGKPSC